MTLICTCDCEEVEVEQWSPDSVCLMLLPLSSDDQALICLWWTASFQLLEFFFLIKVDVQYCVNFCCAAKWFSYIYIRTFFFKTFFSIMVYHWILNIGASQVALVIKNLPADAGNVRDVGSVPGLGRSPGGAHGNPLQYSCLENPMGRGAFLATVHGVTKSQTQLKWFSTHTHWI